MQVQSMFFERKASEKLNDPRLQENLKRLSSKFVNARATSILELEDFEGTRSAAVEIRNRSIKNLDVWLELFEQKAVETGAKVLFARTPQEAAQLVVKIAEKWLDNPGGKPIAFHQPATPVVIEKITILPD